MNSVNNLSDTAKPPSAAANILASLSASYASGNPADGLFANFLSEVQTPPPPPPNPSVNTQTGSSSSASDPSQSSSSNAATDDAGNTTAAAANPPPANASATTSDRPPVGKSHRHDAKSAMDKNKPQAMTGDQSQPAPATTPVPTNNGQTNASNPTPAGTAAAAVPSDPNEDESANTGTANDATLVAGLTQDAKTPAPAVPASAAPATDTSPSSDRNYSSAGTADNDVTASQLTLLLMQLERVAAGKLAAMNTAATPGAANAATTEDANASVAQPGTGAVSGTQGKIDLKALLSELAGQNNTGAADESMTGQASDATGDGNTQNVVTASAATTASLQNALPASGTAADTSNDKWMNASFLNLFNLAAGDQNNAAIPLAANPGINTVLATTGGDGAALDADTPDQGGTNARNAATGVQTPDVSSTLSAGPSQAASPYDFASQLSALRAAKGGSTGLPTPIEQVVLQLSRGISKDGSSQMSIQLRPAELGRVDVKLNIDSNGKVQGTVTADNPATLGLLLKDVRGLERALQEAGLRADPGSLQFNLRGDGQPGGSSGQTTDNQSGSGNNANASPALTTSLAAFADPAETYYLTPGGVDLRV